MIEKLDHTKIEVAQNIRRIFQISYVIEAELIQATHFPPLHRTLKQFTKADTLFYGYWQGEELAAVMEIKTYAKRTLIQSLVVDPAYFRQGIAGKLVQFALDNFTSEVFNVETGAANVPAVRLYEKFGFKKVKSYRTDHGITKVRFERKGDSTATSEGLR